MTAGANIGEDAAMFEAVHGSAPDIAGQGIANPTALLLSGVMMLRHLGMDDAAERIRLAVEETIREGDSLTPDLGGSGTTASYTDAVVRRL